MAKLNQTVIDIVENEREEYCRFDDYARYAKHLTRKLHTTRRSKQSPPSHVYLYAAERAWANAMHQRTLHAKKQIILSKLRKAQKYASEIIKGAKDEALQHLHAVVYRDYIAAILNQERQAYDEAISCYSRALIALQKRGSPLLESVEAGLRFVLYQHDPAQSSVNLQQYALSSIRTAGNNTEWTDLLTKVEPSALTEERGDEMITTIEWVGYTAHLANAELSATISAAASARRALDTESDANAYDAVLASWNDASKVLAALLSKEDDPDRAQELEIVSAWLTFHSLSDRIARNKALIATSSSREGLLLSKATEALYDEILRMPSLSEEYAMSIKSQSRELKGDRAVILAKDHGVSLEAMALLNKSLSYYDRGSKQHKDITNELHKLNARYILSTKQKTWFDTNSWYAGDPKELKNLDPKDLQVKGVSLKPVVFDIAWNYLTEQYVSDTTEKVKEVYKEAAATVAETSNKASKKGFFGLFGS